MVTDSPRRSAADSLAALSTMDLVSLSSALTEDVTRAAAQIDGLVSMLGSVLTEHLCRRVLLSCPQAHWLHVQPSAPLDDPLVESLGYGRADIDQVLMCSGITDEHGVCQELGLPETTLSHWLTRLTPIVGAEPAALHLTSRSWHFGPAHQPGSRRLGHLRLIT